MIDLPHGNSLNHNDLIAHMKSSGCDFIIQGQRNCIFKEHPKHQSLDYWLRENFAVNRDTRQAGNSVLAALIVTGEFVLDEDLLCPDSGRRCKGIRLANRLL